MTTRSYTSNGLDPDITWTVDLDRCTGSGECVQACPMRILILDEGKADCVDIEMCISCCACVNACPNHAIVHSTC
ncbi:MAG: 4Fe-4S binding protein [Candidatus Thermoplasmatota archaeon]|nr:4Fe-4S binding protein [Candidatus Thermoplasmatota archaeon]